MSVPSLRACSLVLRASISASILIGAAATAASAAPALVSAHGVVDASSDGHDLLLADGSVLDRTTDATVLEADPLIASGQFVSQDLASSSAVVLERELLGGDLSLRTPAIPGGTLVNIDPTGKFVPAAEAVLARDGDAVIFSTAESVPRIIERDLTTGVSTVRLTGAALLDASEDGNAITFSRALPSITRPSGPALSGDPTSPIQSSAVGYQVAGDAPRLVDQTHFVESQIGTTTACPTYVSSDIKQPLDLQISQDGAAGPYVLTESTERIDEHHQFTESFKRIDANGTKVIGGTDGMSTAGGYVTTDPVSGAYVVSTSARAAAFHTGAGLTTDDGRTIPLDGAPADVMGSRQFLNVVPFSRGAGAASYVVIWNLPAGQSPQDSGTWVDNALGAVGPSTTAWMTLPRAGDPVVDANTKSDATWVTCTSVVGAPADYAAITTKAIGSSAGKVAVAVAPAGKLAAKSVAATVTWFGVPVWTRTVKADSTITLPALFVGLPGFKLAVKITLADGSVLTESAALGRTR